MVAGERLAQPPPPENCTIREESRTTVRVSCAESEYIDPRTATYVLQVYDADNRRLLASATSMTPSMLEITDLPAERSYSGLVLSLRIMTEHAMSEATVLYSPHFVQEGKTLEHQRYPGRGQLVFDFESACAIRGPRYNSVQNSVHCRRNAIVVSPSSPETIHLSTPFVSLLLLCRATFSSFRFSPVVSHEFDETSERLFLITDRLSNLLIVHSPTTKNTDFICPSVV